MAYMNQEKKSKIAAELKKVMPKDWKWSLGVKHHSTIVLNISAGPKELLDSPHHLNGSYRHLNSYYITEEFVSPELKELFGEINAALNLDNFDKSDIMTDYFHVGHYVDINIGKWDKPFKAIS